MQQKATKYASSGNNVLLNYVDQLFFPNLLSFFNFQFLFLIFNLAGTHLQTVDFFLGEANEVDQAHLPRYI